MTLHPSVVHRPAGQASSGVFELMAQDTRLGFLDYHLPDARTIVIEYVEVDRALRGRNYGKKLVDAAVDWARAEKKVVRATCGFAMALLQTVPEYQDVRPR